MKIPKFYSSTFVLDLNLVIIRFMLDHLRYFPLFDELSKHISKDHIKLILRTEPTRSHRIHERLQKSITNKLGLFEDIEHFVSIIAFAINKYDNEVKSTHIRDWLLLNFQDDFIDKRIGKVKTVY
jgi:hypothetical protein